MQRGRPVRHQAPLGLTDPPRASVTAPTCPNYVPALPLHHQLAITISPPQASLFLGGPGPSYVQGSNSL
jgi:hypothetical protein